jgi:hypothetical protein
MNIDTLRWIEPQDRPVVMGHAVRWLWDDVGQSGGRKPNSGPRVLNLRLGVDIYNASDSTPDRNLLRWSAPSPGLGGPPAAGGGLDAGALQRAARDAGGPLRPGAAHAASARSRWR